MQKAALAIQRPIPTPYLKVTVPEGVGPGQAFSVPLAAGGSTFAVAVPEGFGPGQQLSVSAPGYDAPLHRDSSPLMISLSLVISCDFWGHFDHGRNMECVDLDTRFSTLRLASIPPRSDFSKILGPKTGDEYVKFIR